MKKLLIIISLFLINSTLFAQFASTINCYDEVTANNVSYTNIQTAITSSTPYDEVIIIARDSGATPTIPAWFTNIINDAPVYYSKATFGNLDYNIHLLTDGTDAFSFAFGDTVLWSAGWDHVHSQRNVFDVLTQADAIYDYKDFDFDGDDIVRIHFMSIGPKSGGVGQDTWTYTSADSGTAGLIDVVVKAQTRAPSPSLFENAFYHETGHDLFHFPDMDHVGTDYRNHYSLGSFEIMATTGFQGVPSLYNPFFRHDRNWFTPIPLVFSHSNLELKDFQKEESCYLYEPSALSSDAINHQRFYVSYHKAESEEDNKFYHTWPFKDPQEGGLLIWHTRDDTVTRSGNYGDWRRMDIDIESAHGKFDWVEYDDSVSNTGVENPLTGRDSLEIRKIVEIDNDDTEIQGPYYQKDKGSTSVFFLPDDGKNFSPFTNPNSNWINKNFSKNYAQNIISGFSVKNLRTQSGKVYVDFVLNDFLVSENTTLAKGKWQIENNITVASGVTLTIQSGTELVFESDAKLIVNGTLDVNGTSSNKVVFDFVAQNSSAQNGIKINNGASANIDHAIIENAYRGIYVEEDLTLTNSEIKDCHTGLYQYSSDV